MTNRYKALRIDHHLCSNLAHAKKRIDDLKNKGYGGIVTNVAFDDYLESQEKLDILRQALLYAKEEGMRIWLYDEKGYPSGSAGGLTLRANPAYEAKALTAIIKKANKGESLFIETTKNHTFLGAYAYEIDTSKKEAICEDLYSKEEDILIDSIISEKIDLKPFLDKDMNLVFTPQKDLLVCYFQTKALYEGTHAIHNVCASRRYVSLINKDAVKEFIENTYKKYTQVVGDLFDNGIEAIFTDEPSFMTGYINKGLFPNTIDDPYDEDLPLLPTIPWEDFLASSFDELVYLYGGTSKKAQKLRLDFYKLMTKLYHESFFKQIGDYCTSVNLNFSGHLLLEESILHHPIYEGNIFKLIGEMAYPGIDMLTTLPRDVLKQAATPKLISSSAKINKRKHVMSEVSGHMQGATKTPYGIKEILGSLGLQYALGVDTFTSYYDDNSLSLEENRLLNNYIGRIGQALDGGSFNPRVALYYPIESAYIVTKGTDKFLGERTYGKGGQALETSWLNLIDSLTKKQIEFDCIDLESLIKVGKNAYEALVMPSVFYMPEALNDFNLVFDTINLKEKISTDFSIKENENLAIRSLENTSQGYKKVILIVNFDNKETETYIDLDEKYKEIYIYDPLTDKKDKASNKINLKVDAYLAKLILCN